MQMTWTGEHLSPHPSRSATPVEMEWMQCCNPDLLYQYEHCGNVFLLKNGCIRKSYHNAKEVVAKIKNSEPYREGYEIPLDWDERTRVENIRAAIKRYMEEPRNQTIRNLYNTIFDLEETIKSMKDSENHIAIENIEKYITELRTLATDICKQLSEQRQQDIDLMRLVG